MDETVCLTFQLLINVFRSTLNRGHLPRTSHYRRDLSVCAGRPSFDINRNFVCVKEIPSQYSVKSRNCQRANCVAWFSVDNF